MWFDDVDIERLSPAGRRPHHPHRPLPHHASEPLRDNSRPPAPEHEPRDDRRLTRVPYELCIDVLWQAGPWEPRDLDQVVLEAEAYRRLSYTWHSYQPAPQSCSAGRRSASSSFNANNAHASTSSSIRGTAPSRLTLTHDGLAPAARFSRPAAARTEQTGGWPAFLANLKTLLETGDALPPTPATTAAPGQAA